MRFWSFVFACMLLFSACGATEPPKLSAAEQAYVEEALAVADEMYTLRADAALDESTKEALKQLYLERVYTRGGTPHYNVFYLPSRIRDAQKFLGGVSDYELDWARVGTRGEAVEVQLKLNVYGNKNDTTEWLKLRIKPDDEEWMRDNQGSFVIVSHQIRL